MVARDGQLFCLRGATETPLLPISAVPITFGGAARYNVENALGATAAALALGLALEAIRTALQSFTAADNPGRGETWTHAGVTLFLDFAHNPDGVRPALQLARSLRKAPGGRLMLLTGSAGDRSSAELEAIVDRIHEAGPTLVILRELPHYLRGRAPGEVPAIFRRALKARGFPDARIFEAISEVAALERALTEARPGDVIALLVHVDRAEVRAFLEGGGWRAG